MSGALRDPLPFLEIKSRPNDGYHVKEHKKLCKISKNKLDPFKAKKSYGDSNVGFVTFSEPKNEKNVCKLCTD